MGPVFKSYNNCTYFFEWKTNILCGKVPGSLENCSINNKLGDHRNLRVLMPENSTNFVCTLLLKYINHIFAFTDLDFFLFNSK